jgi:glycosyltransferase involved in cell wall biosynthesis
MNSKVELAVLLPNYNNAPYLREALDSILAQTFQNFIVYFVDDCSTDNSIQIAESFEDSRIVIIKNEKNRGIVYTMNRALSEIETEFYIRMDGDDISTPNRFEVLVNFMKNNPKIGVCSSAIQSFGIDDSVMNFGEFPEMNKANLIFGHSVGHASSIFRTSVIKDNNIKYEDDFWRLEDYLLFYRLLNLTDTSSIKDVLYNYRRESYNNNEEITKRKNGEFRRIYEMILNELSIEVDQNKIELHVELSGRIVIDETYPHYKKYKNSDFFDSIYRLRNSV